MSPHCLLDFWDLRGSVSNYVLDSRAIHSGKNPHIKMYIKDIFYINIVDLIYIMLWHFYILSFVFEKAPCNWNVWFGKPCTHATRKNKRPKGLVALLIMLMVLCNCLTTCYMTSTWVSCLMMVLLMWNILLFYFEGAAFIFMTISLHDQPLPYIKGLSFTNYWPCSKCHSLT